MTTRKKIIAGFITIFAIGLVLGICGFVSTNMLTTLSEQQYQLQHTGSGISTILNAHYTWRQSLTEAVLNGSKFEGSLDPTTCALGQWRHGEEAGSITDQEVLSLLQQVDEPHAYIHNQAKTVVEMINAGKLEDAKRELTGNILPRTADVIKYLTGMESSYAALIEDKGAEIIDMGNKINMIIIILLVISAIVSFFLAMVITGSIMKPIHDMANVAKTISTGDTDVHIDYNVKDEIGQLADAFRVLLSDTKKQVAATQSLAKGDLTVTIEQRSDKDIMNHALGEMVENLNSMFSEIQAASAQVSSGASQVSQGAQELASGSSQQSASIEEFSATLADMQDKTNHSAENSNKAREANGKTAQRLEGSISSMGEMLKAMKGIDESSQSITRVIKVIDDIAFQTNILALNAAVEAARAGQHGKGFAVVADEVRSLAAKSAEAAKETSELIEGSSQRVKEGNEIVAKTNADLEAAAQNARESTSLIEQVAAESVEQAKSIAEISQGIEQISSVVQSNSATAQQSAAAAEEMSAQSVVMNEIVAKFKLKEAGRQGFGAIVQTAPAAQHEVTTSFAMSGGKY